MLRLLQGIEKVVIDVGNRDLEFRAYDLACNYAKREFHLYNNYMVWVNSTKMGDVSGLDTTYTAAKDISRTGVAPSPSTTHVMSLSPA